MADEEQEQNDQGNEEEESVLDPEGGGEEGDGSDEGSGGADLDVNAIVDRLESRLGERFDSIADRRVNALLKEIRKQSPPAGTGESQGESGSSTQQPTVDVRNARMAFREYVTDDVQFLGAEEREMGMSLGATFVQQAVLSGETDEDEIGRQASRQVKETLSKMRAYYEKQTKAGLARRGLLKEAEKGQPPRGGSTVTQGTEFERGAALAKQMFPGASA